jgi:hypothetical protein
MWFICRRQLSSRTARVGTTLTIPAERHGVASQTPAWTECVVFWLQMRVRNVFMPYVCPFVCEYASLYVFLFFTRYKSYCCFALILLTVRKGCLVAALCGFVGCCMQRKASCLHFAMWLYWRHHLPYYNIAYQHTVLRGCFNPGC